MNKRFVVIILTSVGISGTLQAAVKPVAARKTTLAVAASTSTVTTVPPEIVKRRQQIYDWGAKADPSKAPSFIEALGDKDPYTRVLAAQSLGELRWASARGPLESVLLTDPNPEVRESAAQALRRMPAVESSPSLIKALNDSTESVRIVAADTLGMAPSGPAAVQALCAALADQSVGVRRTAVFSLRRLNDVSAVAALEGVLKDPDTYVRANAVQAIGMLSDRKSPPAVIKGMIHDREPLVQVSVANALAPSGDKAAFDKAKSLLPSSDRTVKMLAIETLGWSKDSDVKAQLKTLANDADLGVKQTAQQALRRMDQKEKYDKK